jgi:hypothetical protein
MLLSKCGPLPHLDDAGLATSTVPGLAAAMPAVVSCTELMDASQAQNALGRNQQHVASTPAVAPI